MHQKNRPGGKARQRAAMVELSWSTTQPHTDSDYV